MFIKLLIKGVNFLTYCLQKVSDFIAKVTTRKKPIYKVFLKETYLFSCENYYAALNHIESYKTKFPKIKLKIVCFNQK